MLSMRNLQVTSKPVSLEQFGISENVLDRLRGFNISDRISDSLEMRASGGSSDIFKASLLVPSEKGETRCSVAVKRLRFYIASDVKELFEKEMYVWSKLDHKNVSRFLGYAFDDYGFPLLVSEWMNRGSSWQFINENRDFDVFPFIIGIARGLAYLHDELDAIHSNIRSENVFVSNSDPPDAVIGGFGATRLINASLTLGRPSFGMKGISRYMAVEILRSPEPQGYSKECDVWAFGMTVFELLTRERPYSKYRIEVQVLVAIQNGELPVFSGEINGPKNELLKTVCARCWNSRPEDRITIRGILRMLEGNGTEHDSDSNLRGGPERTIGCLAPIVNLSHVLEQQRVTSVRFSPDGELIAIGSGPMVSVYSTSTGAKECELDHGPEPNLVQHLCFSHTSSILATSASDWNIRIWDISENEVNEMFSVGSQSISSIAYDPSAGKYVAYALEDGSLHIRNNSSRRMFRIQNDGAVAVTVSPDGQTIATGCVDACVRLWDWKTRSLIRTLGGFLGPIKSLAFSPNGTWIVGCGGKTLKKLHASEDSVPLTNFPGDISEISDIAVGTFKGSPSVVSGSKDGTVRFWSLNHGDLMQTLEAHSGSVVSVDTNPKANAFATADPNEVKLWAYNM